MEHDFPFDPTHGYDLAALQAVPPPPHPPHDFAAFWRNQYQRTMDIPPRVQLDPIASPNPDYDLYEITFDSLGDLRIGGWLTRPRAAGGKVQRGVVVGHGYGGRTEPGFDLPGPPAVAIYPCARGFHRSAKPDLPAIGSQHVLHGIASRDTYLHLGSVADMVWCAASALLDVEPAAAQRLDYIGGSFGGGMGALGLPWDKRFHRAQLGVPSFGNHPLRLTLPCTGSGHSVQLYHQQHPEVVDVLAYFDAATAATYMHLPVLFDVAQFDPAVPPPGQFAVANACPQPKTIFIRTAGHFDCPQNATDDARLQEEQKKFFA